jgi:hypothetical protein
MSLKVGDRKAFWEKKVEQKFARRYRVGLFIIKKEKNERQLNLEKPSLQFTKRVIWWGE